MPSSALETYIRDLRDIHTSGAGVKETSYYGRLETLLNAVGARLKPKVKAIINLANRGAGIPDGGLFTSDQFERGESEPMTGQLPSRGAMEVKGTGEDVLAIAKRKQVADYLERYGLVLVTNYRDFLLIRREQDGSHTRLERYALAPNEAEFWNQASDPHTLAAAHGERFEEFLERVLLQNAPLSNPADVAWLLASYAREALARVEHGKSLTALKSVRESLENGLGISFKTERGEHFFRSTLVQTLFYGLFSAWVLWCDENPEGERFEWKLAGWELHVPVIKELFEQLSSSSRLQTLNLVEVMGWAGDVLNRVQREPFFKQFQQSEAVQYFYEPFLKNFDPKLRKEFGVWYTPPEVVGYMVERVDRALRDELGLELGLADENVIVLDPCTGTGSFIVEILNRVHRTLEANGAADALSAIDLKQVALHRVIGFEIMPAPFVVAHLQIGLRLRRLGSPLKGEERPAVYLTNALTGWKSGEPQKPVQNMAGLSEERDAAQEVKQKRKILVVIGNPPYDGYASIARMLEERSLTEAYRTVKRGPAPQGQGLNQLYVRFFRLAERSISENGGRGVVCFISGSTWLNGLSHPGMREKYLETFNTICIDNLNGDSRETGKLTPDGLPDPSIFSTPYNREGIQVGTAIALMTKTGEAIDTASLEYRAFWGKDKLVQLEAEAVKLRAGRTLEGYEKLEPPLELGFPFVPMKVGGSYLKWPKLPDLFPVSFPGLKTSRDDVVTDIDRAKLETRMVKYFDRNITDFGIFRLSF